MKYWSFISPRKFRKVQHLLCFFGFQWPNNPLKMVLAPPNDQKYPRYPLVLKLNVTLALPLRLVILYFFKWKILSDDRRLYLHDSKWNSRSGVDGLTHTKQLLNLLCIVYITCQISVGLWIHNLGPLSLTRYWEIRKSSETSSPFYYWRLPFKGRGQCNRNAWYAWTGNAPT